MKSRIFEKKINSFLRKFTFKNFGVGGGVRKEPAHGLSTRVEYKNRQTFETCYHNIEQHCILHIAAMPQPKLPPIGRQGSMTATRHKPVHPPPVQQSPQYKGMGDKHPHNQMTGMG